MISDREIWACAIETIRQHGEDAAIHAAMKADELLEVGAIDGSAAWQRVVRRIIQLEANVPRSVH